MRTLFILLTSGLIRGLVGQAIGTGLGFVFINLIRVMMGLETNLFRVDNPEPGAVFGALVGVLGFLAGAGVFTDWAKSGEARQVVSNSPDSPVSMRPSACWSS